jgi:hypothetical protein
VPIAALVAATDVSPPPPESYVWPDAAELDTLAGELVRRGLTHGFAGNLAANLLTLDSRGRALTCRITTNDILVPQRWLASTSCYTASTLPDRFFVVVYQNDNDRKAVRATLPDELERFSVGNTYEVHVFPTAPATTAWLDLPIPDGELATFPMHIPATHLQIRRSKAVVESGELVATGEPGTVVYGPYIDLPKGRYTATWVGNGKGSVGQIRFRVTGHTGHLDLATVVMNGGQLPYDRSNLVQLEFTLTHATTSIEVTVESVGGAAVSLHELVIERDPSR